ncbi:MAG: hypothetical protein ABSF00_05575 [Candidatus Bathyarchaeia archaeon]|jgi:hypothetical protein
MSETSKSKAKNALFKRCIVSIHMETSKRIRKAKSQSLLSSVELGESAKL